MNSLRGTILKSLRWTAIFSKIIATAALALALGEAFAFDDDTPVQLPTGQFVTPIGPGDGPQSLQGTALDYCLREPGAACEDLRNHRSLLMRVSAAADPHGGPMLR